MVQKMQMGSRLDPGWVRVSSVQVSDRVINQRTLNQGCWLSPIYNRNKRTTQQGENQMNSDQMQGKWKQIKGSVKERWGKLTDDDIDVINGKHDQLVGKIQERYGIARDAAQKQVDEWNAVDSRESDLEQRRKAS